MTLLTSFTLFSTRNNKHLLRNIQAGFLPLKQALPILPAVSPLLFQHEKQYQLQLEREQHYRLMIEKEQRYVDLLRSQIALCPDEKKCSELAKTEKNLQTLQAMLQNHIRSQTEVNA